VKDSKLATYEWIGKRLRWAREQIPLTQTELAHALGVSTTVINKVEKGLRPLELLSLISAANRLRTGTEYLLTGELVAVEPELRERLVLQHPELLRPAGRPAIPPPPADEAARMAEEAANAEKLQAALRTIAVALKNQRPPRRRQRRPTQSVPDTGTDGPALGPDSPRGGGNTPASTKLLTAR